MRKSAEAQLKKVEKLQFAIGVYCYQKLFTYRISQQTPAPRNGIYNAKHPPSALFISRPSSSPRLYIPLFKTHFSLICPMTMMNGSQQNIPAYVTRTCPTYPPQLISYLISAASGHGTSNLPNASFACIRHARTPSTRLIFPSTISSATLGSS
jgi:hypothetical protein